jgi:hypothetical protein
MRGLSGYLLASTVGDQIERSTILCEEPLRSGGPTLRFVAPAYLKRWDELELTSPISLEEEGEAESKSPGPFRYRVYVIRGFSKLILLAERRRVVEYIISHIFDKMVAPRLRKVALHLDDAIRFCEQPISPYLITSILGRFAGSARQIRVIALYGDDITDTPLFREQGHLFNYYSCGMGRRLQNDLPSVNSTYDREIIRVGNDGFILAHLGSRTKAREFMSVISFIVEHRWMEEWVPLAQPEAGAFG